MQIKKKLLIPILIVILIISILSIIYIVNFAYNVKSFQDPCENISEYYNSGDLLLSRKTDCYMENINKTKDIRLCEGLCDTLGYTEYSSTQKVHKEECIDGCIMKMVDIYQDRELCNNLKQKSAIDECKNLSNK